MQLTWIDLNSWIYRIGGKTILVDPWLVDPLVFYGQAWLFKAYHAQPVMHPQTLSELDLILLSQGQDDHCHLPTLALLDRRIPVVASAAAAKKVRSLQFETVHSLSHWQQWQLDGLEITAIPGAPIQPGVVENGWLIAGAGERLYYEPHQFPLESAAKIAALGPIDAAIAPVIGQALPLLGQVIMGPEDAMKLVEHLQPGAFLPTSMGEILDSGLLPRLIRSIGSLGEFGDRLNQHNQTHAKSTRWLPLSPGQTISL
jgi:L-ascorbate metabolism protein UlaG (beta-lactamase superfamily)